MNFCVGFTYEQISGAKSKGVGSPEGQAHWTPGLQEAESANGGTYQFLTLMLRTDEALPQTPLLYLTGSLAVQLSSCQLTPQTQLRVYLRIYSRSYPDRDGVERKTNEVTCWKIDVLDPDGHVAWCIKERVADLRGLLS